jgi:transposase InsO family protein
VVPGAEQIADFKKTKQMVIDLVLQGKTLMQAMGIPVTFTTEEMTIVPAEERAKFQTFPSQAAGQQAPKVHQEVLDRLGKGLVDKKSDGNQQQSGGSQQKQQTRQNNGESSQSKGQTQDSQSKQSDQEVSNETGSTVVVGIPYVSGMCCTKIGTKPDRRAVKFSGIPGKKPSWRDTAFTIRIDAQGCQLWGFYSGEWIPPTSGLQKDQEDYRKMSKMAYSYLVAFLDERLYQGLRAFVDKDESARLAWEYLKTEYEANDTLTQIDLAQQLGNLQLGTHERNEEYLSKADGIRDDMVAVGLPVLQRHFILQLVNGLPHDDPRWSVFRSTCQLNENLTEKALRHMFTNEQKEWDLRKAREKREKEKKRPPHTGFIITQPTTAPPTTGNTQGGPPRGAHPGGGYQPRVPPVCCHCMQIGHVWKECQSKKQGWYPTQEDWNRAQDKQAKLREEVLKQKGGKPPLPGRPPPGPPPSVLPVPPPPPAESSTSPEPGSPVMISDSESESDSGSEEAEAPIIPHRGTRMRSYLTMVQTALSTAGPGSPFLDSMELLGWYLDSGATLHMTGDASVIGDLRELPDTVGVQVGDGQIIQARAWGEVIFDTIQGPWRLVCVLWVPELAVHLLSMTSFMRECNLHTEGQKMYIKDRKDGLLVATAVVTNKLLQMQAEPRKVTEKGVWRHIRAMTGADLENWQVDDWDVEETARERLVVTSYQAQTQQTPPPPGTLLCALMVRTSRRAAINDTKSVATAATWHKRFSHANEECLQNTARATDGMIIRSHPSGEEVDCVDCLKYKMTQASFKRLKEPGERFPRPLHRVHSDIAYDMADKAERRGVKMYLLVFKDGHTSMTWGFALSKRSEVPLQLRFWLARVQQETGLRVDTIVADRAGEYNESDMKEAVALEGVRLVYSTTATPQQNSLAERQIRTLKEGIGALLHGANLGRSYWEYAMKHLVSCLNRTVHSTTGGVTPWELYYKVRPNNSQIKTWGCICLFYVPKENRTRFEGRARWGIFMGCGTNSTTWGFLPINETGQDLGEIQVSTAAHFFEHRNWSWWKLQDSQFAPSLANMHTECEQLMLEMESEEVLLDHNGEPGLKPRAQEERTGWREENSPEREGRGGENGWSKHVSGVQAEDLAADTERGGVVTRDQLMGELLGRDSRENYPLMVDPEWGDPAPDHECTLREFDVGTSYIRPSTPPVQASTREGHPPDGETFTSVWESVNEDYLREEKVDIDDRPVDAASPEWGEPVTRDTVPRTGVWQQREHRHTEGEDPAAENWEKTRWDQPLNTVTNPSDMHLLGEVATLKDPKVAGARAGADASTKRWQLKGKGPAPHMHPLSLPKSDAMEGGLLTTPEAIAAREKEIRDTKEGHTSAIQTLVNSPEASQAFTDLKEEKRSGAITRAECIQKHRALVKKYHKEVICKNNRAGGSIPYHEEPYARDVGSPPFTPSGPKTKTGLEVLGIHTKTRPVIRAWKHGLNSERDGKLLHHEGGLITIKANRERTIPGKDTLEDQEYKAQETELSAWEGRKERGLLVQHPKARQALNKPALEDIDNNTAPQEALDAKGETQGVCLMSASKAGMVCAFHVATLAQLVAESKRVNLPPEPRTLKEAKESEHWPEWKVAMEKELQSLDEHRTWELQELPPHIRPLGVKWVWVVKTTATGGLDKFKARLVVQGYRQIPGVDFNLTYAPVARFTSFRTLMSLAAANDMEVIQLDVKNAFLYGELEETELYVKQPPGFEDGTHRACRLVKSLYGLKQAPLVWYLHMQRTLRDMGWKPIDTDWGVFTDATGQVWLLLYVDDILLVGKDREELERIAAQLCKAYSIKREEEVKQYLGINVNIEYKPKTKEKTITISLAKYCSEVRAQFGLTSLTRAWVPITLDPSKDLPEAERAWGGEDVRQYQSQIGKLQWAASTTRPDVKLAASILARGSTHLTQRYVEQALRALKYLVDTAHMGITYSRNLSEYTPANPAPNTLTAMSDATHHSREKGKGQSGWVLYLNGGAISWGSSVQKAAVLSSAEAELVAAVSCVQEIIHTRRQLRHLGHPQLRPTLLLTDNTAITEAVLQQPVGLKASYRLYWLQEQVELGEVELVHVPGREQWADALTKPLVRGLFETCRDGLSVQTHPSTERLVLTLEGRDRAVNLRLQVPEVVPEAEGGVQVPVQGTGGAGPSRAPETDSPPEVLQVKRARGQVEGLEMERFITSAGTDISAEEVEWALRQPTGRIQYLTPGAVRDTTVDILGMITRAARGGNLRRGQQEEIVITTRRPTEILAQRGPSAGTAHDQVERSVPVEEERRSETEWTEEQEAARQRWLNMVD